MFIRLNIKIYNYKYKKFAIITKERSICGLFSFYIYFLGCINKYINKGYIPIVDLKSYPNGYNGLNISINYNPWEKFFEQPYRYTMEEVLKNAKNIVYIKCKENIYRPNERKIYYNNDLIKFWRNLGRKYIPIKKEIQKESNFIIRKLFKNSNNILGVKIRGTDYIKLKLKAHPIPPSLDRAINDVKKLNLKNNYDWIFISSEDDIIKERFIKEFRNKITFLNPKTQLKYNYTGSDYLIRNKEINGNIEYAKNYVMNIYILGKCTDIVMSRGSGGVGVIIFTDGFRNSLIYNLGEY
jgi:hypothetical protein